MIRLEEALDGAVSGDTVVLLKDYELTRDITVPSRSVPFLVLVWTVIPVMIQKQAFVRTEN